MQALQYLRKLCSHPLLVLQPSLPVHLAACTAATDTRTWEAAQAAMHASLEHAPKLLALQQLLHQCNIGCKTEDGKLEEGVCFYTEMINLYIGRHVAY